MWISANQGCVSVLHFIMFNFIFILWQWCAYGLIKFRPKKPNKHLISVRTILSNQLVLTRNGFIVHQCKQLTVVRHIISFIVRGRPLVAVVAVRWAKEDFRWQSTRSKKSNETNKHRTLSQDTAVHVLCKNMLFSKPKPKPKPFFWVNPTKPQPFHNINQCCEAVTSSSCPPPDIWH